MIAGIVAMGYSNLRQTKVFNSSAPPDGFYPGFRNASFTRFNQSRMLMQL